MDVLVRRILGFIFVDIENLMNEVVILIVRKREKKIKMEIIEEVIIKVIVGVVKKLKVISEKERRFIVYYEGGYVVCVYVFEEVSFVY